MFKVLKKRKQKKELEKAIAKQQEIYNKYKNWENKQSDINKTCNYCWYCLYKWDCKSPNYSESKFNSNICQRFDIEYRFKK